MRVIAHDESNPEKRLEILQVSDPQCGAEEVLIRVMCAGVNRADLRQRAGKYPPPKGASPYLGLEVSGVIERVGEGVTSFKVGDRVCALLSGGGYAELAVVCHRHVFPAPTTTTWAESAAIPEAFLTAYTNLCVEARIAEGENVLIHGGSSGVGTAAIQIATTMGCRVACTVGSAEKEQRCRQLGAECAINYKTGDFSEGVRKWCGERGIDVILDIVGGEYFVRNLDLLAHMGRMVSIATMSGSTAELNIATMMKKRARIIGSVLRTRSVEEKAEIVDGFRAIFLPLFEVHAMRPVVEKVYSFSEADIAHAAMRASQHVGKLILSWE